MKKQLFFGAILLVGFIMFFFLYSCNNAQSDWEKAKQQNTIESYNEFLANHAESIYKDSALFAIQNIDYEKVKNSDNMDSLSSFVKKYPGTAKAEEIENKLHWKETKLKHDIPTYENFIRMYPDAGFSDSARKAIAQIQFDQAVSTNTVKSYQEFIEKDTTGFFDDQAKDNIDNLYKNTNKHLLEENSGRSSRVYFGSFMQSTMTQYLTLNSGQTIENYTTQIGQITGLYVNYNNNRIVTSDVAIGIYSNAAILIPDKLHTDFNKFIESPFFIDIYSKKDRFLMTGKKSETPIYVNLGRSGSLDVEDWTTAVGVTWKFNNTMEFETKDFKYIINSLPASISFTRYGVELKNVKMQPK